MANTFLAHNVFFKLRDNSPITVQTLVDACKKFLTVQAGIVFFACGSRESGLNRDVNDCNFDVALHIVFASRADHDAYQDHDLHHQFVTENKTNWQQVRVFDSLVETILPRSSVS